MLEIIPLLHVIFWQEVSYRFFMCVYVYIYIMYSI